MRATTTAIGWCLVNQGYHNSATNSRFRNGNTNLLLILFIEKENYRTDQVWTTAWTETRINTRTPCIEYHHFVVIISSYILYSETQETVHYYYFWKKQCSSGRITHTIQIITKYSELCTLTLATQVVQTGDVWILTTLVNHPSNSSTVAVACCQ